jgi:hypothetical protein
MNTFDQNTAFFVIPLGAGRIDEQTLTRPSIQRLDTAIQIANREALTGFVPALIALGDHYSTWRQESPYETNGSALRAKYLRDHTHGNKVIEVHNGFCTLTELISLRSLFPFVSGGIIVTHPEHINRVRVLTDMIFNETMSSFVDGGIKHKTDFRMRVESGDLPAGSIQLGEEGDYLSTTVDYLKQRFPPDGVVPKMSQELLSLPVWKENHPQLIHEFQRIFEKYHGGQDLEGTVGFDFYRVPGVKR